MNLTHFHPKSMKNLGKKQHLSKHQICRQNIRHQKFLLKHQKWQHWCLQKANVCTSSVGVSGVQDPDFGVPDIWIFLFGLDIVSLSTGSG